MQTEAELEAKATQAERWRRPLAVLFVVLACFCVALWGGGRRDSALLLYLLEHGWPTSTPLLFFLASAMTGVTSGWLEWRISRLADAIARARTVADISGNTNPRVGVLGESDPRPRK